MPGLPDFYVGIISRRGTVYPLVDIRRLFGFHIDGEDPFHFAILLTGSGRAVAVGAHVIAGLSRWRPDSISPRSMSSRSSESASIKSVAAETPGEENQARRHARLSHGG